MNISLDAKVLWCLIFVSMKWWEKTLFKKYFHVNRKTFLDKPLDVIN
jgi:hypothetical protein